MSKVQVFTICVIVVLFGYSTFHRAKIKQHDKQIARLHKSIDRLHWTDTTFWQTVRDNASGKQDSVSLYVFGCNFFGGGVAWHEDENSKLDTLWAVYQESKVDTDSAAVWTEWLSDSTFIIHTPFGNIGGRKP